VATDFIVMNQIETQSNQEIKRTIFERIWWILLIAYPPLFIFGIFSLTTAHGIQPVPYACISSSLIISLLLSFYSLVLFKKLDSKMVWAGIAQGAFFSWPIFGLYAFAWMCKIFKIS
jgi:hypothetical protein